MSFNALPMDKPTYPTRTEQEAYWLARNADFENYLNDLHARQSDPDYIKSYCEWIDRQNEKENRERC